MTPLSLALVVALGSGPFDGLEEARRPQKLEPFWYAVLPAQKAAAVSGGVVALRVPRTGRVRIPGGQFVMGSTTQEMVDAMQMCTKEPLGMICPLERHYWSYPQVIRAEGHEHQVTVSDFELDLTEVTVERYMRCVSAGECSRPGFTFGDPRFDRPNLPVTQIAWDDASSFCSWAGGRLPTEAEWEYAARGRVNNTFPWGNVYNPHLANHGMLAADEKDATDGFLDLAPVGSFPDGATPTGVLDLAGNAAEWVFDYYDRDQEQFGYALGAQVNPRGSKSGAEGHVIRGGSYASPAFEIRSGARYASKWPAPNIGFRCAADVATR